MVHVEPRFVSAFVILVWAALFSAFWIPRSVSGGTILRSAAGVMIFLSWFSNRLGGWPRFSSADLQK